MYRKKLKVKYLVRDVEKIRQLIRSKDSFEELRKQTAELLESKKLNYYPIYIAETLAAFETGKAERSLRILRNSFFIQIDKLHDDIMKA